MLCRIIFRTCAWEPKHIAKSLGEDDTFPIRKTQSTEKVVGVDRLVVGSDSALTETTTMSSSGASDPAKS